MTRNVWSLRQLHGSGEMVVLLIHERSCMVLVSKWDGMLC